MNVREEGLNPYLRRVERIPSLSREEELEVALEWQRTKAAWAADKLLGSQLRSVVSIARKFRAYGVPVSDLIAEGNLGLLQALERFEPERGYRFSTYANFWVKARIINHVLRCRSIVQTSSGAMRTRVFFRLRRERSRLEAKFGEGPEAETALANEMNVSKERLRMMLHRIDSSDLSMDATPGDGARPSLVETLADEAGPTQEQELWDKESRETIKEAVQTALEELDERELRIVRERIMADREDEKSLAELGRQMGISRERARQLEARAKAKLQKRLKHVAREVVVS